MATPFESAQLNLQLFDLRREPVLRAARSWFVLEFNPESFADLVTLVAGDRNAAFRMVVSYWDMAAALVNDGAISLDLFNNTQDEHLIVFAKVEPFLREIRETYTPDFALNLEKLVDSMPEGRKRTAEVRDRQKAAMERFAAKPATDKPGWK